MTWTRDGVPLDVTSGSGRHILHSNGSLEVWPGDNGDHVYQCRVTLGEVGSLLSTPAILRSPGERREKSVSTARRGLRRHQTVCKLLIKFQTKQDTLGMREGFIAVLTFIMSFQLLMVSLAEIRLLN